MMRAFKAKYTYRISKPGSIIHGNHRRGSVQVEASNFRKGVALLETAARRCCKSMGDEVFVRLDRVTDRGEIANAR